MLTFLPGRARIFLSTRVVLIGGSGWKMAYMETLVSLLQLCWCDMRGHFAVCVVFYAWSALRCTILATHVQIYEKGIIESERRESLALER